MHECVAVWCFHSLWQCFLLLCGHVNLNQPYRAWVCTVSFVIVIFWLETCIFDPDAILSCSCLQPLLLSIIWLSPQAFVISFTSEFVPRMIYQYMYSANGTLNGYTDHSLSYFNVSDFPPGTAPTTTLITGVSVCRSEHWFETSSTWILHVEQRLG